jgi:hypothetical protein
VGIVGAKAARGALGLGLCWLLAACSSEGPEPTLAMGPDALVEPKLAVALSQGQANHAFALLAAASEQDPDDSFQYSLALRAQLKSVDGLLYQAGAQALEALQRLPARPRAAPYEKLEVALPGQPEVAYVSAPGGSPYSSLFVDMLRVLGKGTPAELAGGAAPLATQRVVLAPGVGALGALPPNRVVALGPQPELEAALGLGGGKPATMTGCVLVSSDPALPLLAGLSLPIEGAYTSYASAAARPIALLRCADGEHPAVFRLERSGGEPAFMFAFDLLASLVRTRQGDPALAHKEVDGVAGLRPSDLFARPLSAAELQVPFTDRLMQAALELVEGERPTLRFWQNPAGSRGVFIVTSDQDFAQDYRLAILTATLRRWDVPATLYLTSGTYQPDGKERLGEPSPALVKRLRELGFSMGAHTYLFIERGKSELDIIKTHTEALRSTYGVTPHSSRFHIVIWRGYDEPARNLAAAGYRYDTSYFTLNSEHIDGLGYMTGGGLPLHFRAADGSELPVRQLPTQLDDHAHPIGDTGLRDSKGKLIEMPYPRLIAVSRGLIEGSGRRFHSPLVVNNHPYQFADDPTWMRTMIDTARAEQLALLDVEGYDAFVSALGDSAIRADAAGELHVLVQAERQDVLVRHYPGDAVLVDGKQTALRKVQLFERSEKVLTLARGAHRVRLP